MLHFDAQKGLYPDDVSTVRETVRQDWIAAFQRDGEPELDTDPATPAGQLVTSQTAHIVQKDSELLSIANQFDPKTAEGRFQDALARIYYITRKREQSSYATCTVMGLEGTTITVGAQIRSNTDNTVWANANEVVIPSTGTAEATFVCLTPGPITAGAETLTDIVTITPGWDSVVNPAAAIVGRDVETQMEFEKRRYDSVAINARGSVGAIYGAVSQVQDVLDCVVLENITNEPIYSWGVTIPGHSIFVSVEGGDDADIAEAIYRKKDAGCGTAGNTEVTYQDETLPAKPIYTYQIERPEEMAFQFRVTIRLTDFTTSEAESTVRQAILDEFNGNGPHGTPRVGMAQEIFASRFFCSVVAVANISSLESILMRTGDDQEWVENIVINANQAPVLDESDIIISFI